MTVTTKAQLTTARRKLVELMHRLNFGRIENLRVCNGEPVLEPQPTAIREHKFSAENGPRPEASHTHFVLRPQHLDLLRLLDQLGNGTIAVLTVKHGVPFQAEVPE